MEIRDKMVSEGFKFLRLLGDRDLLFSGISGSVSYTPAEGDDVDIFLVTQNNKVWSTLLRALVLRIINRDSKICLSFIADERFAESLFRGPGDYIMASDAVHMIPFEGEKYYRSLISSSPFVMRYFPDEIAAGQFQVKQNRQKRMGVIESASFLLLSCWLALKSMYHNHGYRKSGRYEDIFRPVISPHGFYFDSVKYHNMRETLEEWVPEDA